MEEQSKEGHEDVKVCACTVCGNQVQTSLEHGREGIQERRSLMVRLMHMQRLTFQDLGHHEDDGNF